MGNALNQKNDGICSWHQLSVLIRFQFFTQSFPGTLIGNDPATPCANPSRVQFQRNALGVSWAPSSFFLKSSLRVYRKCSWSSLVSFEHSSVSFWSEVDGKCSQPKNRWDMFLASTLCANSLSILYSIILENQWEMSLVLPEPNPPRFLMKYLLEMYVGCPWSSLR